MEDSKTTPSPLGEIELGPSAFEQFMDKNQKKLLLGVILLVLIAAGIIILNGLKQEKLAKAGQAFVNAETAEELQAVITEHADTPSAGSALLALSEKQWSEDKKDEAIAGLKNFLNTFPEHPAKASAQLSLGTKLASQGQLDEAKTTLQPLTGGLGNKFSAPLALVAMGDISREQGNIDEAESFYQQAKDSFAGSDRALEGLVKERIGIVRAAPPTLIDPPKVETPTAVEVPAPTTQSISVPTTDATPESAENTTNTAPVEESPAE